MTDINKKRRRFRPGLNAGVPTPKTEMVVDIQCIWPSLPQVAACFDTAFVTTDEMVHIPGARHIEFEAVHADESAQKVVRLGIAAFKKRRGKKVDIPDIKTAAMAGFSVEAIAGVLSKINPGDPLKPVIDNLASGNILGFAGVVGCSSIKFRDGEMTERVNHPGLKAEA